LIVYTYFFIANLEAQQLMTLSIWYRIFNTNW